MDLVGVNSKIIYLTAETKEELLRLAIEKYSHGRYNTINGKSKVSYIYPEPMMICKQPFM